MFQTRSSMELNPAGLQATDSSLSPTKLRNTVFSILPKIIF
jgi:hypothetical protein